jgi:sterol desaturase/sphingolipid hydroxylase (fatty acid hydroxylase superfamily)
LHRWHHSKLIEESDTNFGNNVIVWDLLFGTWFLPKDRHVGVLGLFNPDYPTSFWGQLKAAFAKRAIDKPSDFYENEANYLSQLANANRAELSDL